MKEENIDKRIERVAESVGSKNAAMRQWEAEWVSNEMKRKIATKRWCTYGISAAASIVLICGIGFGLFINRSGDNDYDNDYDYGVSSNAPVFRGGSCDIVEIQDMINSAKYEKALHAIDVTLADTVIDPSVTPERQDYLRSVNANREYELTWLKVNVLIKSGEKTEAISLLKEYVKTEGEHQKEAQTLLNSLTK